MHVNTDRKHIVRNWAVYWQAIQVLHSSYLLVWITSFGCGNVLCFLSFSFTTKDSALISSFMTTSVSFWVFLSPGLPLPLEGVATWFTSSKLSSTGESLPMAWPMCSIAFLDLLDPRKQMYPLLFCLDAPCEGQLEYSFQADHEYSQSGSSEAVLID